MARPRVLLNCAISLDGRLAGEGGSPVRISGPQDMARVHQMRAEADAILVGVQTVVTDDPALRIKGLEAPDPLRVILDPRGRSPPESRVLDGSAPTLFVLGPHARAPGDVDVLHLPLADDGRFEVGDILEALGERGIKTLMVEGGAQVLAAFAAAHWDTWTIYQSPAILGDGPQLWPEVRLPPGTEAVSQPMDDGVLWTLRSSSDGPG